MIEPPETPETPAVPAERPADDSRARTYELPTARRVVGAGIQLAVASTADLRRASLYIGLLALAVFGPAIVFLIASVDHLDLDLAVIVDDLAFGEGLYLFEHPELVGPLLFLEALVGLGLVLLLAISIDAQAMGITILAGRAATRPITLPEAVSRARQIFWRLLGGSLLVGVYSSIIQFVVGAILGASETGINPALDFVVAMLATLATVPFAYLATGIVLGDVGTVEALRRSTRLFRARPTIALVVVLFTLVTSAIQVFALGAGLDIVAFAGETLGFDVTEGGVALVPPIILSLAAVMAFGSLLFTIAALISAPQVAAFLGLTFYAGGLDRARAEGGRPPGFRWVSRPMEVSVLVLIGIALLGILTLPRAG